MRRAAPIPSGEAVWRLAVHREGTRRIENPAGVRTTLAKEFAGTPPTLAPPEPPPPEGQQECCGSRVQTRRHPPARPHPHPRERWPGTTARPRLNVYRSVNHIYVQLIDDPSRLTIVSASSEQGKDGEEAHCRRQHRGGQAGGQADCRAGQGEGIERWSSTAAAICTTGGSRPWRMRRARRAEVLEVSGRGANR